jgi:hypothetical protein
LRFIVCKISGFATQVQSEDFLWTSNIMAGLDLKQFLTVPILLLGGAVYVSASPPVTRFFLRMETYDQ